MEIQAERVSCPSCGEENKSESRFCAHCGKSLPEDKKERFKFEREAKAKGLEYYERKTQKKGADARVTDFGCHIQVDIIESGKVVISLTYREGEVQEI